MPRTRPARSAFLSAFLLPLAFASGCGGSGSTSSAGTAPVQYLYSTGIQNNNAVVVSYPVNATGAAVVPTSTTVVGSADLIRTLRPDGNGNLYVMTMQDSNFAQVGVNVYAMSDGHLTLRRAFTTYTTGVASAMAVDKSGNVYITLQRGGVDIFSNTASGAMTSIQSPGGTFGFTQLITDSSSNIWGLINGTLMEYAPGFGNNGLSPKTIVLNNASGNADHDLAITGTGLIFVAADNAVYTVNPATSGPQAMLTGSATALAAWESIAVDATNNLWVATGGEGSPRTFSKYTSAPSGNTPPVSSFTTPGTYIGSDQDTGLVIY